MSWHPASHLVDVGGVQAHYVRPSSREGAPPLLLLHGFLVSSWAWRYNIDHLARHWDVIAPCQKGFGWSSAGRGDHSLRGLGRFMLTLLDRIGLERFDVIGNSYGGSVALWLAHEVPERVGRMVLVNPFAVAGSIPRIPTWATSAALAPFWRVLVRPTVARAGLQSLAYRGLRVDSDYLSGFRPPFSRRRAVRTALEVARGFDEAGRTLERWLPTIDHEALVIWGRRDLLLKPYAAGRIAGAMPRARLVTLPAVGHCAHEEVPRRFHDLVEGFLLSDEGGGSSGSR